MDNPKGGFLFVSPQTLGDRVQRLLRALHVGKVFKLRYGRRDRGVGHHVAALRDLEKLAARDASSVDGLRVTAPAVLFRRQAR
jgi:hypothetical protein